MFDDAKNLTVVSNDELYINLVKKLVETKDDDSSTGKVVGTKDGSVTVIAWNQKVWLDQKKPGLNQDKILFIGNIKGTDSLTPLVDWKFNQWGIRYGWSGKQAIVIADVKGVSKKADYMAFLEEFKKYTLPMGDKISIEKIALKNTIAAVLSPILAVVNIVEDGIVLSSKHYKNIQRQQILYGIMHFYLNHLEEFMKA